MCLNPIEVVLKDGVIQEVACHQCWQCVRRRIDDWQGRCIAESLTSRAAHAVTLTYGRDRLYNAADHLKAAVLTYSDVQAFLKHLRGYGIRSTKKYPVRYFVCGEYGHMKGRAHWHALLFWQQNIPEIILGKNVDHEAWPHGHTYWQMMTPETVRYVTKYVAKEVGQEARQYHLGLSTRPPLGDQYFRQLAAEYIEARLAPQDFFYSFADVRDEKNHQIRFQLQGRSRQNFLRYFVEGWTEKWGDHAPNSDLVEAYEDQVALREKACVSASYDVAFIVHARRRRELTFREWEVIAHLGEELSSQYHLRVHWGGPRMASCWMSEGRAARLAARR